MVVSGKSKPATQLHTPYEKTVSMLVCRHSQVKHKNKRQGSEHLLKLVYSLPVGGFTEIK